jgi:hypothetical protein
MIELLKKYCLEICLLLIVVIVLLRTSRILERFQGPSTEEAARKAEEDRYRQIGVASLS